jgi:hypothetical protein
MKSYLHTSLILWLLLLGVCSSKKHNDIQIKSTKDTISNAAAADRIKYDTNDISISGPTVIAYFTISPKEIVKDTNYLLLTALSDFQYYINNTREYLMKKGIELITTYNDTIKYHINNKSETFTTRKDTIGIGYIFINLNKKPKTYFGVMTDYDLLSSIEIYFSKDSLISNYKWLK